MPFIVNVARRLLESTGCLFVKQRAGYLSYAVDPKVCCFFVVKSYSFVIRERYLSIYLKLGSFGDTSNK